MLQYFFPRLELFSGDIITEVFAMKNNMYFLKSLKDNFSRGRSVSECWTP